jgi:hypothetical protein
MKINEYLKLIYESKLFGSRAWRAQVMHKVKNAKTTPLYPQVDEVSHYFITTEGERVDLDGDIAKPLLGWKTLLTLEVGDLPGVTEKINTQYGSWLVNIIGFILPYDGKIPYVSTPISPSTLHKTYLKAIVDGIITTRTELRKGVDALEMLIISDAEFGVKSSASNLMDDDPVGDALRASMLKEYGDSIEDPIIQAEFDARLIEHKKTLVEVSGAKDFYGKGGKLYSTVMMKTDGRYGSETDPAGNRTKFISKSLKESWINAARAGSQSRGALTALSGADVKELIRATSSLIVTNEDDCGAKVGHTLDISEHNFNLLEGVYLLNGKDTPAITDDVAKTYIGKSVTVRAPNGCLSGNLTYCRRCMGIYNSPNGIALGVAALDSILMLMRMKAAHGNANEVAKFDLTRHTS